MKWGWLLGALALAAFLLVRRRQLGRWTQLGGWLVVAGAAVIGVGIVELPNLEELMLDVGRALGPWTYLLVGVLAFLETGAFVGLIAPGETTVIVGGVVAGQGEISLSVLIAHHLGVRGGRRPRRPTRWAAGSGGRGCCATASG